MSSADAKLEKHSPHYSRFPKAGMIQYFGVIILHKRLKDLLLVFVLGVLCPTVILFLADRKSEPQVVNETLNTETVALEESKPKEYYLRVILDNNEVKYGTGYIFNVCCPARNAG